MQDFNNFSDVKHLPLRIYNRAVYASNILADSGEYNLIKYLETFNENERLQILMMNNYIRVKGVEEAKRFATKDLEIEEDVG